MAEQPVGANQPTVVAAVRLSISWLKDFRLAGSTGLASNGRAKRATVLPRHLVRELWEIVSKKNPLLPFYRPTTYC